MYVCLCHGFNCKAVKQAISEGANSCAKVYKSQGVAPNCGKCASTIREMVRDAAAETANQDEALLMAAE
ncbi:(2Fe-2S)-binding protein [Rhodovibrionaceae bacterium A322]